ncbi:MAG: Protein serine/threonine phosphatase PrpC, regulation of stationary phase [uncultured Solirubrobacteraceae bacterium]|uniref:Protein serine/threonine phosphatase PrpC, regulation of stationary phase n=1 Tax=uncultured Solirubrobacteraceae bacterium TaxID=1162706 RepID=A0A6J4SS91_9ACTN|nr:MAG: Protein serine/threonine phosphatase PrpC, regulation of stationary phase [uncultured Solirubrobacteraceae bacterium]
MLRVAEAVHVSDTGRHRKLNEDRWFVRAPLFAVADGMGGAPAGEVASQIAVDVLEQGLPDGPAPAEERLAALVVEANTRIHDRSRVDADRAGMGTTMTTAWLGEEELSIAHVGDSRLYCLRDGRLERLTRDHSLVEDLMREGRITPEEAEEHPQRSIVTRALGAEAHVLADHFTWRAKDADVYLICSDGLTDMVKPERAVGEIVAGADSLLEAGRALVEAANAAGGRDNITVVLFRVEEIAMSSPSVAEETMVGGGLTAADVRAALAERAAAPGSHGQSAGRSADPRGDDTVSRRVPLPAGTSPPGKDRSRAGSVVRTLAFFAVFGLPVLLAAFIAIQSVYFVGTNDEGFVTLYRGLPYDLPAGADLYTPNFVSGVATKQLAASTQKTIAAHKLRSREDGEDLVRQIELGRLRGEGGRP